MANHDDPEIEFEHTVEERKQYPSFRLLENIITFYNKMQTRQDRRKRKISELAGNSKEVQSFYKDVKRLEDILKRPILTRVPGHGTDATPDQARLLAEIADIVRRVKDLCDGNAPKIQLNLATSHLLSLRIVSPLLGRFYDEIGKRFGRGEPGSKKPEVKVTLTSPFNLAHVADSANDYDLILTFASRGWVFDKKPLGDVTAHRCILVRKGHEFAKHRETIEGGYFDFEMLQNCRVAMLANEHRIPDFAQEEVERYAKIVVTNSTLESHAHVLAGTADLTFSHKDILAEDEIRGLCSIDLGRVKDLRLQGTRLCLLAGQRRRFGDEEMEYLEILQETLLKYLKQLGDRYAAEARLVEGFSNFKYSSHTSFIPGPDGKTPGRRVWLPGQLTDWEVTKLNPGRSADYYVSGKHKFGGPSGEGSKSRIFFGRVMCIDPTARRFLWNGTYYPEHSSDKDTGSFNIVFRDDDLIQSDHVIGIWSGIPTWLPDKGQQISGCMIFHKNENLSNEERTRFFDEQEKQVKSGGYGDDNPQNPWGRPILS